MIAISRGKRDKTSQGDNGSYLSTKKENEVGASYHLPMTPPLNARYKSTLPVELGENAKRFHWNIKTMALNEIKSQRLSFHCNKLYHHLVEGLTKNKLMPSVMLVLIMASFNLPTCLSAPVEPVASADVVKLFEGNQVAAGLSQNKHLSGNAVRIGELQEMMVLVELAASQSNQNSGMLANDKQQWQLAHTSHLANRDDLLLMVLANQLTEPQRATGSSSSSSSPVR